VDGCADVSLGVDALLKIIDTNGDDMGQAHINLNPFLSPEKLDTPHHLQVLHPLPILSTHSNSDQLPSLSTICAVCGVGVAVL
jgi:hypothetical protein